MFMWDKSPQLAFNVMVIWDDNNSWSLYPLINYFRDGTDFLEDGGLHTTQLLYLRVHTLCGWKSISKMD